MAAKVDLSGIFDNALPMAYIRKITLSEGELGSNRRDPSERPQPHKKVKDRYGKTKLKPQQKKKRRMTPPDRSRPLPRDFEGTRQLTVTVELVLKDAIGKNGRPIWFDNDELLKYLNLRVVMCTDQKAGRRFLKTGVREKSLLRFKNRGMAEEKIITLKKSSSTSLTQQRREKIGRKTIYSVPYSVTFTVDELNPEHLSIFAMTVLETGAVATSRQAYAKQIKPKTQGHTTAEVVIRRGTVKNNAYVYMTPDNGIWAGPMHFQEGKGQQHAPSVATSRRSRRRRPPRRARRGQFVRQDRRFRSPVEATTGAYMAGAFHSSQPHPILKQQSIPNFIVDDYRLLNEAKEARLQLRPDLLEKQQNKRRGKRHKTPETNKIRKKEKYMSNLYVSRSPSNASNFMFHVDFEKIIRFETQFGKLLETTDPQAKLSILSKSKIKNLRIFRHRVKRFGKEDSKDAEWPTRTELIAYAAEEYAGNLAMKTREAYPDNANINKAPKLVGAIKEIKVAGSKNLRSFAVSDYDMSDRTDGLFQYSISFQIEDGTIEFAKENLSRLGRAKAELRRYHDQSARQDNYDSVIDGNKRSYQLRLEKKYPLPPKTALREATRDTRDRILAHSLSSAPWVMPIATYIDCLFNLTTLSEEKAEALTILLYGLCNPTTGNPTGILTAISQMEELEYKIKNSLEKKGRLSAEMDFVGKGKISQKRGDKPMIGIEHRFKQTFDSDILKNTGYDFLGGERDKSIGPRHMSIENYRKRIRQENDKYFSRMISTARNYGTAVDFSRNRVCYLTPSIIDIGNNRSHHLDPDSRRLWFYKRYERIVSTILGMKPSIAAKGKDKLVAVRTPRVEIEFEEGPTLTLEEQAVNNLNSRVLMGFGSTLSTPEDYEFSLSLEKDSDEGEEGDSRFVTMTEVLGDDTLMASDKIEPPDFIADQLINTEAEELNDFTEFTSALVGSFIRSREELFGEPRKSTGVESISALSLRNSNNILDRHIEAKKRVSIRNKKKKSSKNAALLTKEGLLNQMPNQLKALFFSNKPFVKYPITGFSSADPLVDPIYSAMIYYNYKMINRVEVWTGVKKSKGTGEHLIGAPKFKKLTQEMLSEAVQKNQSLLCRMIPYEDRVLGFGRNQKLALPEYDKHFILSPNQAEIVTTESDAELAAAASPDRGSYANLMSVQGELNNIGHQALKTILETSIIESFIEPEYVCTAEMVQQPVNETKFGTSFAGRKKKKGKKKGLKATDILDTMTPQRAGRTRRGRGRGSQGGSSTGGGSGMGGSY